MSARVCLLAEEFSIYTKVEDYDLPIGAMGDQSLVADIYEIAAKWL